MNQNYYVGRTLLTLPYTQPYTQWFKFISPCTIVIIVSYREGLKGATKSKNPEAI